MRALLVTALILASFGILPSRSRAWANAQVTTATARVEVRADGETRVRYELTVHVLGGWLSELEVAGLDRSLVAEGATPPTFSRADGDAIPFRFEVDAAGKVAYRFERSKAPRAGDYVATFEYQTSIAEGGIAAAANERARYEWTFPAWAAGLDAVSLVLRAPAFAQAVLSDDDVASGVNVEVADVDGAVEFTFHRVHLPRSIAWPVSFSLPVASVPLELRPQPVAVVRQAVVATSRDGRPQPTTRWVALAFVVVGIAKRWTFAVAARARGASTRPLVPIQNTWVVSVCIVGLGAAAAQVWARLPEAAFGLLSGIMLLAIQLPARRLRTSRLGGFHPVTTADLRAARWSKARAVFAPSAWTDATRPVGFLSMVAVIGVLAWAHAREPVDSVDAVFGVKHALGLLALVFVASGESMIHMSTEARLASLARLARSLRVPAAHGDVFAFRLVLHRDTHDVAQDARLRLVSEHRAPGLVRLDVALVEHATLGGYVARPIILAVVRQGSEAERILAEVMPGQPVRSAPGGRRARMLPYHPRTFLALERLALPMSVPRIPHAQRPRVHFAAPVEAVA